MIGGEADWQADTEGGRESYMNTPNPTCYPATRYAAHCSAPSTSNTLTQSTHARTGTHTHAVGVKPLRPI